MANTELIKKVIKAYLNNKLPADCESYGLLFSVVNHFCVVILYKKYVNGLGHDNGIILFVLCKYKWNITNSIA